MSDFINDRAKHLTELTRAELRTLPPLCSDFILSISTTTQPLTRYAYVLDLKLFFDYLIREHLKFAELTPDQFTESDFEKITARDIRLYMDYLSLYYKDDNERTNENLGKMRKLCSLRTFFKFLFANGFIPSNVTELVETPKRSEKPILHMEIDEVAKMLDYVESGEKMTDHQRKYNANTRQRDLAILTMFLGTGIRVSELVGLDIEDVDFTLNSFLVSRKGGNQAILYFPDEVAEILRDYMAVRKEIKTVEGDENALFLSIQKRRISVRAVEDMVKKYALQAAPLKKRLSPHKLRSTFGTQLYQETGDIYLVADVLGHKDINTTKRHYADMSDEHRRIAAKTIKLHDDPKTDKP